MSRGMSFDEARRAARRSFGGVIQTKEAYRDQRGLPIVETIIQDLRYGLRMLRKNPAFTIVTILTLALGIGANTAIFSVLDAVMLQNLPVERPQQLVVVNWTSKDWPALVEDLEGSNRKDSISSGWLSESLPTPVFDALRTESNTLSDVFAFSANVHRFNVQLEGRPYSADTESVSGNYFTGLGVRPILGRTILPADDTVTAPPVAVLSYNFWKRNLGGDESVVGKTIVTNNIPMTIVGVTPPEFFGTQPGEDNEMWVTLHMFPRLVRALNFSTASGSNADAADAYW
jgi:MacB-like periplasmic core domain